MRIYTYAIIDFNDRIDKSINGLEGASVYNIPYRDIGIVASDLNGHIRDISKERVLEHEEAVEKLMVNWSVLPIRFFTVFNRKEDILSMMKEYYNDFRENLDRLRNKVEFGIKVIWPGDAIKKRLFNAYNGSNHEISAFADSPGKAFLKDMFRQYRIEKELEEEANKCIAAVDSFFNRLAAEKKLEKLKSDNLLLQGLYLVEKEKQGDFKQAFERLRNARCDLKYLFSGPWPPYNFIVLSKGHNRHDFGADMFDKLLKLQCKGETIRWRE